MATAAAPCLARLRSAEPCSSPATTTRAPLVGAAPVALCDACARELDVGLRLLVAEAAARIVHRDVKPAN